MWRDSLAIDVGGGIGVEEGADSGEDGQCMDSVAKRLDRDAGRLGIGKMSVWIEERKGGGVCGQTTEQLLKLCCVASRFEGN